MGTCKMLITVFLCLDGGCGGMGGISPFSGIVSPFSCFVSIDFSILM